MCTSTLQRPAGLERLLRSLDRLEFRDARPELRVVVVDNDAAGTAAAVCDELKAELRWPIQHVVESRRGIPYARNRAVALVREQVDFLCFVDDDEVVEPQWLDELLRVQRRHDADVVTGAVLPRFQATPPPWAEEIDYFYQRRHRTGTRVDRAFTNNVMFKASIFSRFPVPFDARMAAAGGSDTLFSRRLHKLGYRIVWANQAVAYECFAASRLTSRWVLTRAVRIGTTTAFTERALYSPSVATARTLAAGTGCLAAGTLDFAWNTVRGRGTWRKPAKRILVGFGLLGGLAGLLYPEYRRLRGEAPASSNRRWPLVVSSSGQVDRPAPTGSPRR